MLPRALRHLKLAPRVSEEKECQHCPPTDTYQLLPVTFFSFGCLEMEQKSPGVVSFPWLKVGPTSLSVVLSSRPLRGDAEMPHWTMMALFISCSLETTAWISCVIFCFYVSSVSFHQFPQLTVTIWGAQGPCSESRIICSPAEKCFLWVFSEIASQKSSVHSKSEDKGEASEGKCCKDLILCLFQTLISRGREIINKRTKQTLTCWGGPVGGMQAH